MARSTSGVVAARRTTVIIRTVASRYVSSMVCPGGKGRSRSRPWGCELGARPSTRATAGFVPTLPFNAMYGPASATEPTTRKATAVHHRGQLIRVAPCSGSRDSDAIIASGNSRPSGRER